MEITELAYHEIYEKRPQQNSRMNTLDLQNIAFHRNYRIGQSDWWKMPLTNHQNEQNYISMETNEMIGGEFTTRLRSENYEFIAWN